MTRAEELVRSTTRAIASTVGDVPPLRLEAAPNEWPKPARRSARSRPGRWRPARWRPARWRPGFAPVAAAVVVVLLAVGLVFVKHAQNATTISSATTGTPSAAPTHVVVPDGIPEYYAWTPPGGSGVSVGNSVTGATLVTFKPPGGVYLTAVYGTTDDDRTFVVTGDRASGAGAGTQWYLLRIHPGGTPQAQMTPLPLPVRQAPAGVAISPDATMLAVALSGSPAVLRVYSMATGALLHSWSAPTGQFAAASEQPSSVRGAAMTLRWFPGSQSLGFTWNGTAIYRIDVTAPNGNLLANKDEIAQIGPSATVACEPNRGWDVFVGAQGYAVQCAATWQEAATPPGQASNDVCPGSPTTAFGIDVQQPHVANGHVTLQYGAQAVTTECYRQLHPGDGVYIAYAGSTDANGDFIIGWQVRYGQARFEFLSGRSTVTLSPSLPPSVPIPAGLLTGAIAW